MLKLINNKNAKTTMRFRASLDTLNTMFSFQQDAAVPVIWHHDDGIAGLLTSVQNPSNPDITFRTYSIVYVPDFYAFSENGEWRYFIYDIDDYEKNPVDPNSPYDVFDYISTHVPTNSDTAFLWQTSDLFKKFFTTNKSIKELYQNMKPLVVAICGESGCGKTALSLYLQEKYNIHSMVSYTTRDMRPGETNGKEHWFTTEDNIPPRHRRLAYTYFGNCHYWTGMADLENKKVVTYTIDERGVLDLYDLKEQGLIDVFFIYIERPDNPTDEKRKERDGIRAEYWLQLRQRGIQPDAEITNDYPDLDSFLENEGKLLYQYIKDNLTYSEL